MAEQKFTLSEPSWRRQLGPLLPLLLLVYVLLLFGVFHFDAAGPLDHDAYYHARFAQLLPEFGFSSEFRWTQASTWKEQFCDKEFLFHVLLVPFTRDSHDPIGGARIFAWLLVAGVFGTLWWVLRTQRVPTPALFAALPLCFGALFLVRAGLIRSHLLSMWLQVIGMHFLLQRNWRALALLGFIYAWSYTVPLAVVMTAVPFVLGRWAGRGGVDWKSPVAAFCGVVAGLTLHPYSPHTLETFLTYIQVLRQGADSSGLELGNEIYALPPALFLSEFPGYVAVFASLLLLGIFLRKKLTPETCGSTAASAFWFAMTCLFPRFIEYGALLLALSSGLMLRDLFTSRATARPWRAFTLTASVAAVLALGYTHLRGVSTVREAQRFSEPPRFCGAAQWLAHNASEGETIVHLWWEEFNDLYYHAHRQNFIWGLDPTYTLRFNPELARALEEMRLRQRPLDPAWLAATFNARYLAMSGALARMYPELRCREWLPVYRDEKAVVFALLGPQGPPVDLPLLARRQPGATIKRHR